MVQRIVAYGDEVVQHFGVGFMPPALLGIYSTNFDSGHFRVAVGACLTACFVMYTVVFHALSNLPLSSPMPFEVHRRFWMQPSIIVAIRLGAGLKSLEFCPCLRTLRSKSTKSSLQRRNTRTTIRSRKRRTIRRSSAVSLLPKRSLHMKTNSIAMESI